MDNEQYLASQGDRQAMGSLWNKNKDMLVARVFNPFGILPRRKVECKAVLLMLCELEQFGLNTSREKMDINCDIYQLYNQLNETGKQESRLAVGFMFRRRPTKLGKAFVVGSMNLPDYV